MAASRGEQLDAHLCERRRVVAALLTGSASDEAAPRPFRAVLPGLVAGAVLLAGFAVFGMVRPGTPPGWRGPGSLLVGRESAGRYVQLDGRLHPVLNVASARLLLDPGRFRVATVPDRALDRLPRGPVLGIPGAPDRLPAVRDLRRPQAWTVCALPPAAPGGEPGTRLTLGAAPVHGRLGPERALFVRAPSGDHLVAGGRRHLVRVPTVRTALGLDGVQPSPVGSAWLATVEDGGELTHPDIAGHGRPVTVAQGLPEHLRVAGTVLRVRGRAQEQHYVVTPGGIVPISPLIATLLLAGPPARVLPNVAAPGDAVPVGAAELADAVRPEATVPGTRTWPVEAPVPVNPGAGAAVCNTYDPSPSSPAGHLFHSLEPGPWHADRPEEAAVRVPPGGGALYREVTGGPEDTAGAVYLVTDTGRRHLVVPAPEGGSAQTRTRLGYGDAEPFPLPRAWSMLLPPGPALDPEAARRPYRP